MAGPCSMAAAAPVPVGGKKGGKKKGEKGGKGGKQVAP